MIRKIFLCSYLISLPLSIISTPSSQSGNKGTNLTLWAGGLVAATGVGITAFKLGCRHIRNNPIVTYDRALKGNTFFHRRLADLCKWVVPKVAQHYTEAMIKGTIRRFSLGKGDEEVVVKGLKNSPSSLAYVLTHCSSKVSQELIKLDPESVLAASNLLERDESIDKIIYEILNLEEEKQNAYFGVSISEGHVEILKKLLDKTPGLWKKLKYNHLNTAIMRGHTGVLKELLDRKPSLLDEIDKANHLNFVINRGYTGVLKELLDRKPSLLDEIGAQELACNFTKAISYGHTGVAKEFLNRKPSLLDEIDAQKLADSFASVIYNGHTEVAKEFLNRKPSLLEKMDAQNLADSFICGIYNGHTGVVRELLNRKLSLLEKMDVQKLARGFNEAICCGHTGVVRELLNRKPSLLEKMDVQKLARGFNEAICCGHTGVVRELLERKTSLISKIQFSSEDVKNLIESVFSEPTKDSVELLKRRNNLFCEKFDQLTPQDIFWLKLMYEVLQSRIDKETWGEENMPPDMSLDLENLIKDFADLPHTS